MDGWAQGRTARTQQHPLPLGRRHAGQPSQPHHHQCGSGIGPAEMEYLTELPPAERAEAIRHLFQATVVVLLADGLTAGQTLRAAADARNVPLFTTPLAEQELLSQLRYYLSEALAERITMHGVLRFAGSACSTFAPCTATTPSRTGRICS
ncbi:MAG: hypothetical protein P8Z69_09465 [Acidihalobacter sp.]